jgi:hypothetical protein
MAHLSSGAGGGNTTADAWSPYGRIEANPILQGPGDRFSARSIGIKAGIAGGIIASQWMFQRKHPGAAKAAAITNFGMAAVFSGVAIRNKRLPNHPAISR